jgi:2-dehydro-3-deoxygluconokinase
VGADEFGACIRSTVRGEGVDTSHVVDDSNAPTAVFFKERRRPDETRVYYYRTGSAASRLSAEDLPASYIREAELLHLTGITPALSASSREAVWTALKLAREGNTRVSFDPNIRYKLWSEEEATRVLTRIIPRVDILLAGEAEAMTLTATSEVETAARKLREMGPDQVVIKRGEEGAMAMYGKSNDVVCQPATDVTIVEEIGAGDAFNSGYLAGCLQGLTVEASLRLGTIMGALAVTAPGDVEGLPTREEVERYLEDGPSPSR